MNIARMSCPTTLLATAIAAVLIGAPAFAQDATPQATTVTSDATPQNTATPVANAPQDVTQADAKDLDAVKVVGLRASLQSAQSIKRDSTQIVDS
ncbi:MAG: hypothetical protein ABWX87_11860, partial [Pseudoxanthomonas sp.]